MPTPVSMRSWLPALVMILLASQALPAVAQPARPPRMPEVLTLRDQAALQNRWLAARFETVLPEVMRREQIDMWVVICREHDEDPVYTTLVPHPSHVRVAPDDAGVLRQGSGRDRAARS